MLSSIRYIKTNFLFCTVNDDDVAGPAKKVVGSILHVFRVGNGFILLVGLLDAFTSFVLEATDL